MIRSFIAKPEHKKPYRYRVIVVDDLFTEEVAAKDAWSAIIAIYKCRHLNVAANLIRAFKLHSAKTSVSIDELIEFASKSSEGFLEYKSDIQKYLLLL